MKRTDPKTMVDVVNDADGEVLTFRTRVWEAIVATEHVEPVRVEGQALVFSGESFKKIRQYSQADVDQCSVVRDPLDVEPNQWGM